MWRSIKAHPISAFAIICVALTSGYLAYMNFWLTEVLSGPGFCAKAIGADKLTPGRQTVEVLKGCLSLLTVQANALATNSHIYAASFSLVLVVLIVVVVARAKGTFKAGASGIEGSVSSADDAADAAEQVATAAVEKKDEIVEGGAPC